MKEGGGVGDMNEDGVIGRDIFTYRRRDEEKS